MPDLFISITKRKGKKKVKESEKKIEEKNNEMNNKKNREVNFILVAVPSKKWHKLLFQCGHSACAAPVQMDPTRNCSCRSMYLEKQNKGERVKGQVVERRGR